MEALLQPASDFITRHHAWAGVVLGLVTLLESLLVVGAFVPATALLVLAGGLVASGILSPVPVVAFCVLGAVIGDGVSYAIGRRLGFRALQHNAFKPHRRKIAMTRLYCRRYGVLSIFVGRFFGPLRAFVPAIVGILKMRNRTFQIANVASAFVWVLAMLAPGYFAAKGLARLEAMSEAHALTLVAIGVATAVALTLAVIAVLRNNARRVAARLQAALSQD